jgi:hypothetical protein
MTAGIFDIQSPKDFFRSIKISVARYHEAPNKDAQQLLYILMGLVHLREWIAPGYDASRAPDSDAEKFYNLVYEEPSFRLILSLCHRVKHFSFISANEYGENDDFSAEAGKSLGFSSGHFVDGLNVLRHIDKVCALYEREWFAKQGIFIS